MYHVKRLLYLFKELTNKSNTTVRIQASEYELNKSMIIFNWVKWFIFLIIAIVGIVGAFFTPNPILAISVLLTVILPLLYTLLGLK